MTPELAAETRATDCEEALVVANDTPFGLSSGIYTTNLKYASHNKRNAAARAQATARANRAATRPRSSPA